MIGDMPRISDASHAHTTYGLSNLQQPLHTIAATNTMGLGAAGGFVLGGSAAQDTALHELIKRAERMPQVVPAPKPEKIAMPSRRLVQVFIADPDENVPLDKSLLYSGEQKLTDATDQELFFEIEIKAILEKHNAERVQFINKRVKERTEFLEPVKIRDLKMVVVNVATF